MKTHTQYIELINDYLNNTLSQKAQTEFESKLQGDVEFNEIYQEHIIFLNGLNRIQIKDDILKAKRAYRTEQWLKISGISIIVIGALVMLYTLVFNSSDMEPTSKNSDFNTIILDSTSSKTIEKQQPLDLSEEKTDTSKTASQIDVNYTTTSQHLRFGSTQSTTTEITKRAQIIRLNTQSDTIIKCKEGTVLRITKGSFIHPYSQKPVTGTIDLRLTEYYKLSDILMANLSTVSNGNQLETGGMLHIEAKQNDADLKLKPDASIEISFPTSNKKDGMQLFSGEWKDENINWTLSNIEQLEHLDISKELIEEHIEVPFNVVEVVPTYPGCEAEDNESRKKCTTEAISNFIRRKFNTDVGLGLGLTGRQRILSIFKIDQEGKIVFIQSRAAHPRLSEEADRVIALLPQMSPGMQRGKPVTVPYSLPIFFEIESGQSSGELYGTIGRDTVSSSTSVVSADEISLKSVEMDTIYTERRGMVELIREVMHDKNFPVDSQFIDEWNQYKKQKLIRNYGENNTKRFILRKPLFELEGGKFKILEDDSVTRGGHVIRKPWDESRIPTTTRVMNLRPKQFFAAGTEVLTTDEFEARLGDATDTSITSKDANYYVLKSSKLGWINCDRFINGRTKRIKYKLKIKNAEGAQISMVFKSYNSILPSWYTNGVYDFQTVGANESIVLVAIQRKDGKLYYDLVETKTEANPQLDFDFKEVSLEELKSELEKLNGVIK